MTDPDRRPAGAAPRLDAHELTARARAAAGADGRLALPVTTGWPIFPFDTAGLRMRALDEPVLPEPPRHDETAERCTTCRAPDEAFVWTDGQWRVAMSPEPQSLPGVTIHSRDHLDLPDLTDEMGAGLGVQLVRAQRALAAIEGVGRVHIAKWGDGGGHLHVFVLARPLGMMQLRGLFLTTWMHAMPPLPADDWAALRAHVAAALAAG